MLMQAQTDFDFRLLIGYTGPQGPDYHTSPILRALYRGRLPSVDPAVFQSFLAAHHVGAVIMERGWAFEHQLTALLDIPPMSVQDVLVFRLSLRVAPGGSTVR